MFNIYKEKSHIYPFVFCFCRPQLLKHLSQKCQIHCSKWGIGIYQAKAWFMFIVTFNKMSESILERLQQAALCIHFTILLLPEDVIDISDSCQTLTVLDLTYCNTVFLKFFNRICSRLNTSHLVNFKI